MTAPTRRPFARTSPFSALGRTAGPAPSERVASALEELNTAGARLRQLLNDHHAADREIQDAVSQDPNLSAEGRQNTLRERRARLAERNMAALDLLKSEVESAQQTITNTVQARWPTPAAGVEAMLTRQAAWARSRSLLESGIKVSNLIGETSDLETLYALREELPTWMRTRGANAETAEAVVQRIDLQLAKTAGSTSEVDLTATFEARAIVAGLTPLLNQTEAEITGRLSFGAGLHAAVASDIARRAVEAYYQPIIDANGEVL